MKWRGRRGREGIKQKGKHALLRESVLRRKMRETHVITTQCGARAWNNKSYSDSKVYRAALKC